jgi:pimeloyl-ACP methyl ester carboxylesterase
LIVFVPGVFSDSGNITGQMTLKWFSEMGYHVLVVPNPLAADYVSAGPRNPYPFPQNEVEFVIEATQRAIFEWIDFEWVTDVHIVGESLGAMVAAATLAQDAQSPRPLFKAGGTFLWPPLSLSHSVNQIDQLINRTQAMYSETCRPMIDNLIFQWRVLQGFVLSNPTELETRCAPSLVGHYAFKQNLINVTQVLRKTRGQVPLSADEQMNLRFADFVRDYSFSEPMIEQSPLVSLVHWLKKSETAPWRILSSFDDFINSGLSWDAVGDLDPDGSRLVLLPWGGHIGVSALNEFPRFLRQHFKAPAN